MPGDSRATREARQASSRLTTTPSTDSPPATIVISIGSDSGFSDAGIGGTASYWMTYLQQAGGKMYGEDGMPVFKSDAGVDALQLMVDLMPYTDPGAISYAGINDATNVLLAGRAGMMMN